MTKQSGSVNSAWRLTKDNLYVVGSSDLQDNIKTDIKKLLSQNITQFQFTSRYIDFQILFEDGYQIKYFFCCQRRNQWTLFLSDSMYIDLDLANNEEINQVYNFSKDLDLLTGFLRSK